MKIAIASLLGLLLAATASCANAQTSISPLVRTKVTTTFSTSNCKGLPAIVTLETITGSSTRCTAAGCVTAKATCVPKGCVNSTTVTCRNAQAHGYQTLLRSFFKDRAIVMDTVFTDSTCMVPYYARAMLADGTCVTVGNASQKYTLMADGSVSVFFYPTKSCTGAPNGSYGSYYTSDKTNGSCRPEGVSTIVYKLA